MYTQEAVVGISQALTLGMCQRSHSFSKVDTSWIERHRNGSLVCWLHGFSLVSLRRKEDCLMSFLPSSLLSSFYFLRENFNATQAGLELFMQLRVNLNFWSAMTIGVCHHTPFMECWDGTQASVHAQQSTKQWPSPGPLSHYTGGPLSHRPGRKITSLAKGNLLLTLKPRRYLLN